MALLFFPLFSCVFFLGAQYGSHQAQQNFEPLVVVQSPSLVEFASEAHKDNYLDALALRLGQLQSQMLRLNVIGQRVVEELDIGKDDFDFSMLPAMGGNPNDPFEESHRYEDLLGQVDAFSMQLYYQELQLQTLRELLTTRALELETFPAGRPVRRGWMASSYGWRADPFSGRRTFHSGVDFAAKRGTEVVAVASGLVIWASRDGGYGNLIAIDHGDGYVTRYAHNKDLMVVAGDRVEKGDTIGHAGSTGHSTGTHVHFEVLRHGEKINPEKFIRKAC
ncbi:MAG: M23 family metallopeptidase [Methylococcaceae bacterium]|nr:M23 family metallopeptidase [Methylococcaceae bacterium]